MNARPPPATPARRLEGGRRRLEPGRRRLERGRAAEELAAGYLTAQGITVLARNLRCRGGEIDILCLEGRVLAVIEVRQRSRGRFGGALASVTAAKQRKIMRAARYVLQTSRELRHRPMRFDVIGVEGLPEGAYQMVWIKDAFRAP